MSDHKDDANQDWLESEFQAESSNDYRLAEDTADVKYEPGHNRSPQYSRKPVFEPLATPKKVKTIDLWYWIRLPFSFLLLAGSFWFALNLNSMLESGNFEDWLRNWTTNTRESWSGYFGNGQLSTYNGIISGKNDWVGTDAGGNTVEILESEKIPFTEDGELPIIVERLDELYKAGDCKAIVGEYTLYRDLWLATEGSDTSSYWESFAVYSYEYATKLDCESLELDAAPSSYRPENSENATQP